MAFLAAISAVAILTVVLGALLILAQRLLWVDEDPRIDRTCALLPHTNCGACGFAGCRAFAEALIRGHVSPAQCTVSSVAAQQRIAALLGVEVGRQARRVARLACAGGSNVARYRAHYRGLPSCRAAAQVGGGGKGCSWGCLGLGDCARACTFDAIHMGVHDLPVVDEQRCTACGDCVAVCPKDLFSLHPVEHRLWVACSSEAAGDGLLETCRVACTACGRCVMDAPAGLMVMHNNLPVVNYAGLHDTRAPIRRCPTGAIVWIEPDGTLVRGAESGHIVRQQPLPAAPS